MPTRSIPAMMAAQAVAMRARLGDLDQMSVDDMVSRAEELLDSADPLFRAITGFATQFQVSRHDHGAMAMQGRILAEAVEHAAGIPDRRPPARSDIDG